MHATERIRVRTRRAPQKRLYRNSRRHTKSRKAGGNGTMPLRREWSPPRQALCLNHLHHRCLCRPMTWSPANAFLGDRKRWTLRPEAVVAPRKLRNPWSRSSGVPLSEIAGRCTTTRRCRRDGRGSSSNASQAAQLASSMST